MISTFIALIVLLFGTVFGAMIFGFSVGKQNTTDRQLIFMLVGIVCGLISIVGLAVQV